MRQDQRPILLPANLLGYSTDNNTQGHGRSNRPYCSLDVCFLFRTVARV